MSSSSALPSSKRWFGNPRLRFEGKPYKTPHNENIFFSRGRGSHVLVAYVRVKTLANEDKI